MRKEASAPPPRPIHTINPKKTDPQKKMSTPSPPSSPPSDSNPNSTATRPTEIHHTTTTVVALAASSSAAGRKPQPVLWTNDETLFLVDAYKDKWYSLGRGQLKAGHWEEVASAVSGRSGVERSATQCRHKMEKLRKRFRAESQRAGLTSLWPHYALLEELETRPTPISVRPLARLPPPVNYNEQDDDEEEDDDDDEDEYGGGRHSKSRSINHILRRPSAVNRFAAKAVGTAISSVEGEGLYRGYGERTKKKKRKIEDEGEGERRRPGTRVVVEEIRGFAERVMVIEKKKMEFLREIERRRIEMEMERLQLIQTSQDRLLQLIATAFDS